MNMKFAWTLIFAINLASGLGAQSADIIVVGAQLETMDPRYPQANAIAVAHGRILKVGSAQEIRKLANAKTRIVAAKGAFVMPGFIDSHAHFRGIGSSLRRVRLNGAASFQEVIRRVRKAAEKRPEGQWITGRGWDQNLWKNKEFPHHQALSLAFPHHPVVLTRVDGHALLANAAAMKLARISENTVVPAGGEIIRDKSGAATGVFVDTAESLIMRVVPADSASTQKADMLAAQKLSLSLGITTMHDAGMSRHQIELLDGLYKSGKLLMRLYVMLGVESAKQAQLATSIPPRIGDFDGRLTIRALKIYADGALGSRGAALLNEYADRHGHKGLLITQEDTLAAISRTALARGYQACVHAIGDRANRTVLDTWEKLFVEMPTRLAPRFRIEHAQILHQDDIPRFATLGVIASMQAVHCTSDMAWVAARITKNRAEVGAYAWRSLLDAGTVVCNGTDAPVENLTPFAGLYASVTRMDSNGQPQGGWFGKQSMTRREALYSYTMAGAYAGFEENSLGSLSPGKRADFILVDTNLLTCPSADLLKAKVRATFIGGEEVYRSRDKKEQK